MSILGFVEALVVDVDPEFEFEDRFRSSQKSNEKRQKQLYHLSSLLSFFSSFIECSCVVKSVSRRRSEAPMPCLAISNSSIWKATQESLAARTERPACFLADLN